MEKKVNIVSFILLLLLGLTTGVYCQEFPTEKLKWNYTDSTIQSIFHDTSTILQVLKKVNPKSVIKQKVRKVSNTDALILIVDRCSGVYCLSIYVFVQQADEWKFFASSQAFLKDSLNIDAVRSELLFATRHVQVGSLQIP
jgi:hypothetical protein